MLSLKTLQYSQENICVGGSSGATLLKKTLTQVFSYEHCEIFKNTYFEEHLRTAASRYISKKKKLRLKTKKHEYVMSQTERTGTKNKKLGLKKRNTLVFSVFKSKYDKERTRKTPNTYTFLAVQKLREFSLEKKI